MEDTRRNNIQSHVKGGGQTPLPLDEHAIHVTPCILFIIALRYQ